MERRGAGWTGAALCALALGAAASGCDLGMVAEDEPIEDEPIDEPEELDPQPLISMNSLAWENLADNLPATRGLVTAPLQQSPAIASLADTHEGRRVLQYAVTCGLPAGEQVKVENNAGDVFVFQGRLGVDRDWTQAAPTVHDIECMGGCLAAHINGLGQSISISVRGDECGFTIDRGEKLYDFEEGGFASDSELHFFACTGRGLERACGNTAVPTLESRLCTRGDPRCGQNITSIGSCEAACKAGSGRSGNLDCWYNGTRLQMVTTYLEGGQPYPCDG